jgi:hypothetical protein
MLHFKISSFLPRVIRFAGKEISEKSKNRFSFHAISKVIVFASLLLPASSDAWFPHGYVAPSGASKARLVQNINSYGGDVWMNMAPNFPVRFGGSLTPANLSSLGLPSGTLPNQSTFNSASVSPNYYGHYTVKSTDISGFELNGYSTIIYSGGQQVYPSLSAGYGTSPGSTTFLNNGAWNIEFAFGETLTTVQNSATTPGLVELIATDSNGFSPLSTGSQVQIHNVSNLSSTTIWTVTKISNSTIDLQGSVWSSSMVPATGVPGVAAEAIFSTSSVSYAWLASIPTFGTVNHTISSFVFSRTSDVAAITASKYATPEIVSSLTTLGPPKYLRMMDIQAIQFVPLNGLFSNRITPSNYAFYEVGGNNGAWLPQLYGGTSSHATSGAVTTYTISNGSGSPSGAFQDSETIQFETDAAASGQLALAVTGRNGGVSAPVITNSYMEPLNITLGGSITNGDVISVTFINAKLPTGSYTFNYYVNTAAAAFSGTTSSNVLTVTGTCTGTITPGQVITGTSLSNAPYILPYGTNGSTGAGCAGTYVLNIAPIGTTTITGSTGQAGGSGGSKGPDTSFGSLDSNFSTSLSEDVVLGAAGFQFGNNSGASVFYSPAYLGPLTVSASVSGSATETVAPTTGALSANTFYSAQYVALLNAWVVTSSGLVSGAPFELMVDLCKQVDSGLYIQIPLNYTQASAVDLGQWLATNASGIQIAVGAGNEIWNTGESQNHTAAALGVAIGTTAVGDGLFYRSPLSYQGWLEANIVNTVVSSYVSNGGSRSNIILVQENSAADGQGGVGGCGQTNCSMVLSHWNGQTLTPTGGTFTGTITSNPNGLGALLTVSSLSANGAIYPGMTITGSGVTAGTHISSCMPALSYCTGNGTYQLDTAYGSTVGPISMTANNVIYAAVGGPGATSTSTSYNAFPTRPVDLADAESYATYFTGQRIGEGSGSITGTQSNFNTLFTASQNYAQGVATSNASLITSALTAWSADVNINGQICSFLLKSPNYTSICGNTGSSAYGVVDGFHADVAAYDGAGRPTGKANLGIIQYEGGLQESFGPGIPTINGTFLSTSYTDGGSQNALNNQFVSNGWVNLDASFGYPGIGTSSTFTGTSSGAVLTVTGPTGQIIPGQTLQGSGLTNSPYILAYGTLGTTGTGGVGTYQLNTTPTGTTTFTGSSGGSYLTAVNMVTLFLAYLNSSYYYNDVLFLHQQSEIMNADRPFFYMSQYGLEGEFATPNAAPLWGYYPGFLASTPLQNYNAFKFLNTNWLLKRDLDPASNDNDPMWLEKAA